MRQASNEIRKNIDQSLDQKEKVFDNQLVNGLHWIVHITIYNILKHYSRNFRIFLMHCVLGMVFQKDVENTFMPHLRVY